ncbi:MAG: DUF1906 domain-containing protein [Clostridia bacterium]
MDVMVKATQEWLNSTYGDDIRFNKIDPVTGRTGQITINALIRALQIELGIQNTADNFGEGTITAFNIAYPNGVVEQVYPSSIQKNIYGIIQGALWCKGYSTGAKTITKHFYGGTGNGVISLKSDAGFLNPNSTVDITFMKALLSMKQFKKVNLGTEQVRGIQQQINLKYINYISLIPCDGLVGRELIKALIIALQVTENNDGNSTNDVEPTGNFGPSTKARLPLIQMSQSLQTQQYKDFLKIAKYALVCNGYITVNLISEVFDQALKEIIIKFQSDLVLNVTGNLDVDTWMSLLLSKGNSDRACTACDTRFEMIQERINYVKNNGQTIVGRYINGGPYKELREDELDRIFANGMSFFPIYQKNGISAQDFLIANALTDATVAKERAIHYKIPTKSIIYFAVDFDATDSQITEYIIPYFAEIKRCIYHIYQVGIYGTRNVCTRVINSGNAITCFVSDMSIGYSGNLGFKMPSAWNLDQFYEIKNIYSQVEIWDLDKVSYSNAFNLVTGKKNTIALGNTDMLLGSFIFWNEHRGAYFNVEGNQLRYKIVFTSDDYNVNAPEFHLVLELLKLAEEKGTYHDVVVETTNKAQNNIYTEWINCSIEIDYRFYYRALIVANDSKPHVHVDIYVETRTIV